MRRNGDLDHLAAAPREPGEHRFDQAGHDDVEPVGCGTCLGTSSEQPRARARGADADVDLAVIFDIGVDATAVPEGVVPAPSPASAPTEARAVERRAPTESGVATTSGIEGILDILHLTVVDAVAELNDHVGALRARRGLEATRLKLLRDHSGVALELEAAVGCHATG